MSVLLPLVFVSVASGATPEARPLLTPAASRRVVLTLPQEPPSRVRCSLDNPAGGHAELTWDPEVSGRLSQSVLLPTVTETARWTVSCSASPLPRAVQLGDGGTAVRANVDVAWVIGTHPLLGTTEEQKKADDAQKVRCAAASACIPVTRREIALSADKLLVRSEAAGEITITLTTPPTLEEAKAGLTMVEGGPAGGRSLDLGAEVPEVISDTLTLLAEIAYERAKKNGLGMVSDQITLLVCERMKLPATALPPELGGLADESILPETCELVGNTTLLDLVAAGQDVLRALASDFVGFGFDAVGSLLEANDHDPAQLVTLHVVPVLQAIEPQVADFVTRGRAPTSEEAQVLLTTLAAHDWTSETPTLEECGIELGFAALSTCYAGGACDARALTDILHRPEAYFSLTGSTCEALLPEVDTLLPELPGLVARLLVVVEPEAGITARDQAAAVVGVGFDIAELMVDVDAQRRRGLALDRVAKLHKPVAVTPRTSGREMVAVLRRLEANAPLEPGDVWAVENLRTAFGRGTTGFNAACDGVRTGAAAKAAYPSLVALGVFDGAGAPVCVDAQGLARFVEGSSLPGGNDVERALLVGDLLAALAKDVDPALATSAHRLWLVNGSRAVRIASDDRVVQGIVGWFDSTTAASGGSIAANACSRLVLGTRGALPASRVDHCAAQLGERLRSLAPEAQDEALTAALVEAHAGMEAARLAAANPGADPAFLAWQGWVGALEDGLGALHRARAAEWARLLPDLGELVIACILADPQGVLSNGSSLARSVLERILELDQAHVTLDPKARKTLVDVSKAVDRFTPVVGVLASNASSIAAAAADPTQAEALREARKQAIEGLIDSSTDRRHRDGDVIVSVGSNPGFYFQTNDRATSGATLADVPIALPMGLALDVLPNPDCRSRGGAAARPAGAPCGAWKYLGFHAQLSPVELVNLLDTAPDEKVIWNDFLILGGQAGLSIGLPASTLVVGLDVRYQPFALKDETYDGTDPKKGAVSASIFASYYVPFFDLN